MALYPPHQTPFCSASRYRCPPLRAAFSPAPYTGRGLGKCSEQSCSAWSSQYSGRLGGRHGWQLGHSARNTLAAAARKRVHAPLQLSQRVGQSGTHMESQTQSWHTSAGLPPPSRTAATVDMRCGGSLRPHRFCQSSASACCGHFRCLALREIRQAAQMQYGTSSPRSPVSTRVVNSGPTRG